MKLFSWLNFSLDDAFGEVNRQRVLPEKNIEQAQKHFFRAIEREDLETVERIARAHPDFMTWRDYKDRSPMRAAQETSSFESFVTLSGIGGDKHEDYGNGWTPFMVAMSKRDDVFINYLIDSRTENVNTVAKSGNDTFTPLHLAVLNRDHERIMILIELGADEKVKASPGKKYRDVTPQELAVQLKEPKIAEMLGLAEHIREVKKQEWAEMEEFAKQNAYVPKPDDNPEFRAPANAAPSAPAKPAAPPAPPK